MAFSDQDNVCGGKSEVSSISHPARKIKVLVAGKALSSVYKYRVINSPSYLWCVGTSQLAIF